MPRLSDGQAALAARQQAAAAPAGPVVYHRAAGGAVVLTGRAWVGRTKFTRRDAAGGTRVAWSDRDYLFPAAALAAAGVPVRPARGDRVVETLPEGVRVFEVSPFEDEPEWVWSDPQRTLYRVHCKEVAPAPGGEA